MKWKMIILVLAGTASCIGSPIMTWRSAVPLALALSTIGLLSDPLPSLAAQRGPLPPAAKDRVRREFDPSQILSRRTICGKLFDRKQLQVKVQLVHGVRGRVDGSLMGYVMLLYGNKEVGVADILSLPGKKACLSFLGGVKKEYLGKGLGSLFYHVAARELERVEGLTLRSDPRHVSPSAQKLWSRLARDGYATSNGLGEWCFQAGVLEEDVNFKAMDSFLRGRLQVWVSPKAKPK